MSSPRKYMFVNHEIKSACLELESIFAQVNQGLCSDCPETSVLTVAECYNKGGFKSKEAGCCSKCACQNGYFNTRDCIEIYNLQSDFGFDKLYGFFDSEKKQCRLPRYFRSKTCLKYCCEKMEKQLGNDFLEKVKILSGFISDIRWNHGSIY